MVLGRIVLLTDGEQHSIIKIKWLTKIFVAGDILSFMTQATGEACDEAPGLSLPS